MQRHVFSFEVDATREEVWAALHPPPPPNPTGEHRVLEHGGVRIEDTVVVTSDGCRPLTLAPKLVAVA